jgi:homoserine dehydrogenase
MSGAGPIPVRVWLMGFGTVGRWLARAIVRRREPLAREGINLRVVGVASARDGFVGDPAGIDLEAALALRESGRPLAELDAAAHWETPLEGMRASEAEILAEVGLSPAADGEPGIAHMREALDRGLAVVAANKWPVALAGTELAALARERGAPFRAESTVMSGTPVLRSLTEGLAGARPRSLRGVLNATNNFVLTRMTAGATYEEALAEAQDAGLAEPDPRADVDGLDTASKLMVLAALVFRTPLALTAIERRGISALEPGEAERAAAEGRVLREVATLAPDGSGGLTARVGPQALGREDPLAAVVGTANAIVCAVEPLGEVTISGPGAGPEIAGQGVFADLVAVAGELTRAQRRATSSSASRAATKPKAK